MAPFLDPSAVVAMLLMILSSGVRDLASCLSTDSYWSAKSVTVSVDQLTHELDPIKPADVSKWIADLDADDPKARDEASARIAAVGPAAIPALDESVKNGSPEVVARAKALLVRIRAGAKGAAVRRLMAIRTLGERKEAGALPVLKSLLDSKEMFEADYANAAIAKIEGKSWSTPQAGEAERAADLGLLPSRLDLVAQASPAVNATLSIDKMLDQMPIPPEAKAKAREQANAQILNLLETVGNVQLNTVTWGFYAAPPGQPGNTLVILHGLFDPSAVTAALEQSLPNPNKSDGMEIFQIDADQALVLAGDGRLIFLAREGGGELGLDQMKAALKKGTGDLSANPDLPGLIKTIDQKAPLWAVTKMAPGMRDILGPLGAFDTAALTASQSLDHDKVITDLKLEAVSTDAAKTKQAVEQMQTQMKQAIEEGRKEEKAAPFLKPMIDFVESIKLDADGGKATLTGSLKEMPLLPALMVQRAEGLK